MGSPGHRVILPYSALYPLHRFSRRAIVTPIWERPINKSKSRLFTFLLISLLTLVLLVGAELILRLAGRSTWNPTYVPLAIEPGGRLYVDHPALGYTHVPGRFQVELQDGYSFRVSHAADTLRVTARADSVSPAPAARKEIWIFGCSFTHGWSLNDWETYPWLLQEELQNYKVRNFGVGGYGTVQSLIQFREALETNKSGKPEIAILAYASFHDQRNVLTRNWRKSLAPFNEMGLLFYPHVRIERQGELSYRMSMVEYRELPLMRRSALSHSIEQSFNSLEEQSLDGHAATLQLVGEFSNLAARAGVTLVIAAIRDGAATTDLLRWARGKEIPAVDISVDLRRDEYRNLPHDRHPSPLANKIFAQKLGRYLSTVVLVASEDG